MNIIEAKELNKRSEIISPSGHTYKVNELVAIATWDMNLLPAADVFGNWRTANEQPLELWVNVYEDNNFEACSTKAEADNCHSVIGDRIRCVHMREVR